MIEFLPGDIDPRPDDVCECVRSASSGAWYFGYERCGLCYLLIVTDPGQVARLQAERLASESTRQFKGRPPSIDKQQAREIVEDYLESDPGLSARELRLRLADHGRYTGAETVFTTMVLEVRHELGIEDEPVRPGARRVA